MKSNLVFYISDLQVYVGSQRAQETYLEPVKRLLLMLESRCFNLEFSATDLP